MKPLLCYVTDRHALADPLRITEHLALAVSAGIDWIQIRERDLPTRDLISLTRSAVKAAAGARGGTRIVVNDRLDVAVAAGAGGVHLRGSSIPVAKVNEWRRVASQSDFLIGASCHSVESAQAAEGDGADYVIFGPVFSTPSKMQFGPPQGINRLAEASKAVRIPVLAVGGITEANAGECIAAGAAGIAAIRMFCEAPDLAALAGRLRNIR